MATVKGEGPTVPIPPNGLSVIVNPLDADLDVIFIHGFTGHPERTWTHKKGDPRSSAEPPPKIRRLNGVFNNYRRSDQHPSVFWPRDLLPDDLPNARIMTFGYDSRIRHLLGSERAANNVCDIARDLLVAAEGKRRDAAHRPLLFIVHSLGGIVVKEMLRQSLGSRLGPTHLTSIGTSTRAIIFFGTPHGGADPQGLLRKVTEGIAKAMGFSVNQQIADALSPSSERLRELRDEFAPLAQEHGWLVHSFQENIGLKGLNGSKVVEDVSSYLSCPAIEVTEHIQSDHMDMCRFSGPSDVEYGKALCAITRLAKHALGKTADNGSNNASHRDELPPSPEDCIEFLESLQFDQMEARQATIRKAHAKTCNWALTEPKYTDWLDPHQYQQHKGFLWIKGKPGTGKSTLMKYLWSQAKRRRRGEIVISFFFNARGTTLEKTTEGMYKSLLVQLLEKCVPLQEECCRHQRYSLVSRSDWTLETLEDMFEHAVSSFGGRLTMYIDALDECNEDEIRRMISTFEQLAVKTPDRNHEVLVCFSSRHYPHITVVYGLELTLEGHECHTMDIKSYLGAELRIGHSKLADQIREEVLEKASSIFIWVVLVVQILNKEYDRGQLRVLRRKLREIPKDLDELFRRILEKDDHNQAELLLCIQLVLFATRPLSREELYHAILSATAFESTSAIDVEVDTAAVVDTFILDASKGLTEVTKSKKPTVQFIHESVREFLAKHFSTSSLWPEYNRNHSGKSHSRIAMCCAEYLKLNVQESVSLPNPLPKASSNDARQLREDLQSGFPFLRYATESVFQHADSAEELGVSSAYWLEFFPLARWLNLDNALATYDTRRHLHPTLLYILAEKNAGHLIPFALRVFAGGQDSEERFGTPLLAAIAHASHNAIKALLLARYPDGDKELLSISSSDRNDDSIRPTPNLQLRHRRITEIQHLIDYGHQPFVKYALSAGRQNQFDFPEAFQRASSRSQADLVQYILRSHYDELKTGDIERAIRAAIGGGRSGIVPLIYRAMPPAIAANLAPDGFLLEAVQAGQATVVQSLLDLGADPSSQAATLLEEAIHHGHTEVAELLISGGVNPDCTLPNGLSPLVYAAIQGAAGVGELLLRIGVDPDGPATSSLLAEVAIGGDTAVAPLLLSKDAYPAQSPNESCPLSCAAACGNLAIAELLLNKGADPNGSGTTCPLAEATKYGETAVIKLLLDKGADPNGSGTACPIAEAAKYGGTAVAELLLDKGADLNGSGTACPLTQAATNGHTGLVKSLADRGASLDTRGTNGESLLFLVINGTGDNGSRVELAEFLISNGARLTDEDRRLYSRLPGAPRNISIILEQGAGEGASMMVEHILAWALPRAQAVEQWWCGEVFFSRYLRGVESALQLRKISMSSLLLDSVDTAILEQHLAIHKAVCMTLDGVLAALMEKGVNCDSRDGDGFRPIELAVMGSSSFWWRCLWALARKGVNLDIPLENEYRLGRYPCIQIQGLRGDRLLHVAARRREKLALSLLLENGADRSLRNADGLLPVQLARNLGYSEIVEVLEHARLGRQVVDGAV
ncbi:hypothetical protein F4780DRAFT_314222 [Xylariomycetidae sp. FL0641]|nr:hypothetical protein F4780DRAFT_314222 [Xylariomycetidae sp. FL0641]